MEKGLRAFFYDYKYYLLPDNCADTEDVKRLKGTEVTRLKEENCMAPDFVRESMSEEFLEILEPSRVFPVSVNLYTREEYDELLKKQVERRCPGCQRYGGNSGDLTGHHREISLAGVCYSREDETDIPSFARFAEWLWEVLAEETNELASLIDKGEQKKFSEKINFRLKNFFLPLEIYGGVAGNKYCICLGANSYSYQGLRTVLKMLADTANREGSPMSAAGWTVFPYFPKGIYKPSLRPDYFKRPPRIFFSEEAETGAAEIVFYEKGADVWSPKKTALRKKALYGYLCHYVGENVLLAGSASIAVTEKFPADKREVTVEELAELIERRAEEIYEGEIPFPAPLYLRADESKIETLPFKEGVQTWATICPEMSPERLPENPEPHNTLFEGLGIIYAYICFPVPWTDDYGAGKKEVLDWYISHAEEYPEPITLPENRIIFAKQAGLVFTHSGICEDYMVFDEKEFFRVLRNLAPVLEGLNAKIVTIKRDGVIIYEPGYIIRPADAGIPA